MLLDSLKLMVRFVRKLGSVAGRGGWVQCLCKWEQGGSLPSFLSLPPSPVLSSRTPSLPSFPSPALFSPPLAHSHTSSHTHPYLFKHTPILIFTLTSPHALAFIHTPTLAHPPGILPHSLSLLATPHQQTSTSLWNLYVVYVILFALIIHWMSSATSHRWH